MFTNRRISPYMSVQKQASRQLQINTVVSSDEEDNHQMNAQTPIDSNLNSNASRNETIAQKVKGTNQPNKSHCNNYELLRKQLSDSTTKFGVILGAGISVNAGICAFRGSEGVFTNARKQYTRKLDDDDSADDILAHAFSTQCLRGDPRMQYRVLRQFEVANREKNISPTFSHVLLRNLYDRNKLVTVITQNIDSLEDKVGLGTLGDKLVYAHGRSDGPLTCINPMCPARLSMSKQINTLKDITDSIKYMKTNLEFLEANLIHKDIIDSANGINDQEVPLLISQSNDTQETNREQSIQLEGISIEREQMLMSSSILKQENPLSLEQQIEQLKYKLEIMNQRKQKTITAIKELPAQILFGKYCIHTSNNIQHRTNVFVPIDRCTVLQPLDIMPLYDQKVVKMALLDGAVPCCTYCGTALKPSMVLYEEQVHISMSQTKKAMEGIDSLLVIGTSLNVQPVNLIPCYVPPHVDIHFVSLEIDFIRYLSEYCSNDQIIFDSLVNKKMEYVSYKNAGPRREYIIQELFNKNSSGQDAKHVVSDYISKLSPKITFHQGDCDKIFKEALQPFPEIIESCETMFKQMKLQSQADNSHLNNYTIKDNQLTFNHDQRGIGQCQEGVLSAEQSGQANRFEIFSKLINETNIASYLEQQGQIMTFALYTVFLAVPSLWPPDSVVYTGYNQKQGILCQCTLYQIAILRSVFQNVMQITVQDENVVCLQTKQDSEKISYAPIGGHWAIYMVAYNRYRIKCNEKTMVQVDQAQSRQKEKNMQQVSNQGASASGSRVSMKQDPKSVKQVKPVNQVNVSQETKPNQKNQQEKPNPSSRQSKNQKPEAKKQAAASSDEEEGTHSYYYYYEEEYEDEESEEYEEYEEYEDFEEYSEDDAPEKPPENPKKDRKNTKVTSTEPKQSKQPKQTFNDDQNFTTPRSHEHQSQEKKQQSQEKHKNQIHNEQKDQKDQKDLNDVQNAQKKEKFDKNRYYEYLDPWSAFFMPYKKKDEHYNKYPDMITFQGVAHNFREALSGKYGDIIVERKQSYYQVPPENLYGIILQRFKAINNLE